MEQQNRIGQTVGRRELETGIQQQPDRSQQRRDRAPDATCDESEQSTDQRPEETAHGPRHLELCIGHPGPQFARTLP